MQNIEYQDQDDEMISNDESFDGESSGDDNLDIDDESATKIQNLVDQINKNPYEFALYQELIQLYRQNSMIKQLREVRQRVLSLYCLPVEMWIEWINDEQTLMTPQDDSSLILSLFEQALKDYKYYKVCRLYCKFVLRLFVEGRLPAQTVRDVHEKILQIYGLDFNRSLKFWQPYLEFERQELDKLLQLEASGQLADPQEVGKGVARIRSIYRRRVIFPTTDALITWNEYKEWETDQDELARVQERYEQASEKMDDMVNWEEKFQDAYRQLEDDNEIQPMIDFLKFDLDKLAGDNFNYIQLYFERILSEYTLNQILWQIYLNYVDDRCKKKETKQQIYECAIKNCPLIQEFWLGYMRELEKNNSEFEQIQKVAIQAIEQGGDQIDITFQYEILKALCEFQVRSFLVMPGTKPDIEGNPATKTKVDLIRSMYSDAIENLENLNPNNPKLPNFIEKLKLSWAEVETYKIQDKKKVQELMEEYIRLNGHSLMAWTNYIKLMRNFPDADGKTLRGLFKRALQVIKENKVMLGEFWLEWEKKFGTVQSLDQCIKHLKKLKIYDKIGKSEPQRQNQLQQSDQKPRKNVKKQPEPIQEDEEMLYANEEEVFIEKPQQNKKQKSTIVKEEPIKPTEQEIQERKLKKRTLFIRNLSDDTEEEDLQAIFTKILPQIEILDIRVIRDEEGKKRGIAFVDVATQEMAEKSLKLNNYHVKGGAIKVDLSKPPSEGDKDNFTVYVNNLPFTINEEKIREHFKSCGTVDEVRLPRDKQNKVRGYAYVQFQSTESVQLAIDHLNKTKLDNRTIIVERSQSNKKELVAAIMANTIHVNNISFKVNDDELREALESQFGEVKKLHLVKDDKGQSKGYAFVDFVDEKSAQKAIQEKEIQIKDRIAVLKKSTRAITNSQKEETKEEREKKRDQKKTRKNVIKDIINEVKNGDAIEEKEQLVKEEVKPDVPKVTPMSNSDFKSMLFKK